MALGGVPSSTMGTIAVVLAEETPPAPTTTPIDEQPSRSGDDDHCVGMVVVGRQDPTRSLFDRESTAGPGRDWEATAELLRMKRQLRREERQRRREARRR